MKPFVPQAPPRTRARAEWQKSSVRFCEHARDSVFNLTADAARAACVFAYVGRFTSLQPSLEPRPSFMNKQLCSVKVLVGILRMMLVLTFFSRACTSPHSDKAEAEPALRTQHALFAEPTFTFFWTWRLQGGTTVRLRGSSDFLMQCAVRMTVSCDTMAQS